MNANNYHAVMAEHQRLVQSHKQALADCWETINSFRTRLEVNATSDTADDRAGQMKETFDISGAGKAPASRQTGVLHLMARLDQAEAAAMEIILVDGGPRMDTLAELIANVISEAHAVVAEALNRD